MLLNDDRYRYRCTYIYIYIYDVYSSMPRPETKTKVNTSYGILLALSSSVQTLERSTFSMGLTFSWLRGPSSPAGPKPGRKWRTGWIDRIKKKNKHHHQWLQGYLRWPPFFTRSPRKNMTNHRSGKVNEAPVWLSPSRSCQSNEWQPPRCAMLHGLGHCYGVESTYWNSTELGWSYLSVGMYIWIVLYIYIYIYIHMIIYACIMSISQLKVNRSVLRNKHYQPNRSQQCCHLADGRATRKLKGRAPDLVMASKRSKASIFIPRETKTVVPCHGWVMPNYIIIIKKILYI